MTPHHHAASTTTRRRQATWVAIAVVAGLTVLALAASDAPGATSRWGKEAKRRASDNLLPRSPQGSARELSITTTPRSMYLMYRFISWLAIGVAAAFLVVATASFSLSTIKWLAFAVSIGTLVVSAGVSYRYRRHIPTLVTGLLTTVVSAWTIVASLVFSPSTVQNLALASALAISGLAIVGATEHELANEHVLMHSLADSGERESRLAAAA